jgi:putative endonuclease
MTSNIQSRFEEHENGLVESTKNRRPWKLIYFEAYLSKESAEERERKLKNFGSSYVGLLKRLGLK